MHQRPVDILQRRPWDRSRLLFIVGPGGAGKSSLGRALAPRLGRALVDLDDEFSARIGHIGAFIRERGYVAYKTQNASLAGVLASEISDPSVLVTASGFLAEDNHPPDALAANRALLGRGYAVSLLPSHDIEAAAAIIVRRQLTRDFNSGAAREEATLRARFETYRAAGDLLVCSAAPTVDIADAVAPYLGAPT